MSIKFNEIFVPHGTETSAHITKKGELKRRLSAPFLWITIVAGGMVCAYSFLNWSTERLDLRFLLLALVTITLSSRIFVQIPTIHSQVSVSDTFIFLALLLYDGEAAILLSAVEALMTTLRFSKRPRLLLFNSAVAANSTFLTVCVMRFLFGDITALARSEYSSEFITALCVMALVQYISNSGSVAIAAALQNNRPIWQTWTKNYLWTSITYFAGASAAGLIAKLFGTVGLYALIVATPIVAIVFFTYRTYLKNIESAAAQAAQAERHVEELNHFIVEQERIREQFSQVEKMSALGQLASGVAHDFNNCLAGIMGRAQLSLRHVKDTEMRRNLELIIRSAEDGAKTVRRIQDFARQRSFQDFSPVDVDQLLLDVSEITRPRWEGSDAAQKVHINLELHLRSRALVKGDTSELRDVLVNMIFNAVDAMPQGGTLTLTSEKNDDSVVISVSDTGTGMTQDVCSRVFDPFFTTKGLAGMGLGLAVGYGVISRHDGTIEVDSELGRGTVFRIKLPFAGHLESAEGKATIKPPPLINLEVSQVSGSRVDTELSEVGTYYSESNSNNEQVDTLPQAQELPQSPIRVLVIDDDPTVLNAFGELLSDTGYVVATATSGSESLEIAKNFCPDIILTDYNMPGMNGVQTLQALRPIVPDALSIMITGYSDVHIIKEALRQFVFDFLVKPVSIVEINQSIQRAVIHREARERERRQKDFLSIVSHELRAPLQAPLRYLENILSGEQGSLNEKQCAILQRAIKGIKTEVRLVNNLLDQQYIESGRFHINPMSYSLRSTIQEVVDSYHLQAADSKVNLVWKPPSDAFMMPIDPEQLKQALSNILSNAIEHTPRGKNVKLRLFSNGSRVKCIISDEGYGIPAPYLERIFEQSFQVPSNKIKRGLGIGLYIAREIIRAHGGDIAVKSKLEKGSVFIITLPNSPTA